MCALPSGHVEDALGYLGCQADVLSLDPHSLGEVLDSILAVGQRTGVPDRAARLVDDLRARLARTAALVAGPRRPRVAVVEWVDPPFTAGHWIPDLVSAAGGQPVAAQPGVRSARRRAGRRCRGGTRSMSWWPRAATTCQARSSRRGWRPRNCPAPRSGRSTPTASWSVRDPGWWMASRPRPRSSTRTPCPPGRRRAPGHGSRLTLRAPARSCRGCGRSPGRR